MQNQKMEKAGKLHRVAIVVSFAVMTLFMAADGMPPPSILLLVIVLLCLALVGAKGVSLLAGIRKTAPHSQFAFLGKFLTGETGRLITYAAVMMCCATFVYIAHSMNTACFILSPFAVALILCSGVAAKFTRFHHIVSACAAAVAPLGGWLAVTGGLDIAPILLALAVVGWTAGLDIVRAAARIDEDKHAGLQSLPAALGVLRAMRIGSALRAASLVFLALTALAYGLHLFYLIGVLLIALLLLFEHLILKRDEISRVRLNFVRVNGALAVVLMLFTIADVLLL